MKNTRSRQRAVVVAILLSLLVGLLPGLQSSTVYAHNLDQRMNWIQYDDATMDLFNQRIDEYQNTNGASGQPLMRPNDELGMIIKVTPTDGTTTGAGGYVTFYIPDGESWANSGPPNGGVIKSNSGDEMIPYNKWDAKQMYAWGISDPDDPIVDPNGRGSAPWGMASGVAGPQSGYEWGFDMDIWNGSNMPASIVTGPWQRIQYPGSQIAFDEPGRTDNTLGFVGVDASNTGWALNPSNPLPATTGQGDGSPNALRWSVGALIENRPEYDLGQGQAAGRL